MCMSHGGERILKRGRAELISKRNARNVKINLSLGAAGKEEAANCSR